MAKKTAHKTKIYDLLKIIFTITSCNEVLKAKKHQNKNDKDNIMI